MGMTKAEIRKKIKDLKKRREQFEARLDDISKAYRKCSDLDDYKAKIEKKITDCTNELQDGINRIAGLSDKCDIIEENVDRELLRCRGIYESAMDRMDKEMDRCNSKIDDLTDEIQHYQYLLDNAED